MDRDYHKYLVFIGILIVGVAADQCTKWYASDRLATTRPGDVEHALKLKVDEKDAGETLTTFLGEEFAWNAPEAVERIARYNALGESGQPLDPQGEVEAGQTITVLNRKVVVVDGFFDFEYTENRGAAFGLMSEHDSPYRVPFFVVVSLLALVVILYILRGVDVRHRLLIVALSMIATGAVGNNLIDRLRFGYVVDFIVLKWGDAYRWPTFNVADIFITVGVFLMFIEIIRDSLRERRAEQVGMGAEEQASSAAGDEVAVEALEDEQTEET